MGIDVERLVKKEALSEWGQELVCIICQDLLNPLDSLQAPCGHIFCSYCIKKAIVYNGPQCPFDKSVTLLEDLRPLKDANPIVYRMLGRTLVQCDRCPWQGELSEVSSHDAKCHSAAAAAGGRRGGGRGFPGGWALGAWVVRPLLALARLGVGLWLWPWSLLVPRSFLGPEVNALLAPFDGAARGAVQALSSGLLGEG